MLEPVYKTKGIEAGLTFLQRGLYNGTAHETYEQTRVRMYKEMKTKASSRLLPDSSSARNEIKRVHLQSFMWLRCMDRVIDLIDPEDHGWTFDNRTKQFVPMWYDVTQLPQENTEEPVATKKQKLSNTADNYVENTSANLFNEADNVPAEMDEAFIDSDTDEWQDDWLSDTSSDDDSSDDDFDSFTF